jgi:DNA-binding MarR family transcriptional regulator
MTDVNPAVNPLFLREEDLRRGMELLFYAQRDLEAECDALLAQRGLGRTHQRALHFLKRYPRIAVGDLLAMVQVTKQTLSRVLGELTAAGLVDQRPEARDRRRKVLALTAEGEALEAELFELQRRRLARAYRRAGAESVEGFRRVLTGVIDEAERQRLGVPETRPATPPGGAGPGRRER